MIIAVFAIGNSLMADDGIAEAALVELDRRGIPDGVRLINAAGDPLRIAQEIPELDLAIVLDSADMGLQPGQIRVFEANEAHFPHSPTLLSNHGFGLAQVIGLLRAMGIADRLRLVGVQPFEINAAPSLSPGMKRKVSEVADVVLDMIRRHSK